MRSRFWAIFFVVGFSTVAGILTPVPTVAAATLQQLVEGARKEGVLLVPVLGSQGERGARELVSAFNRRFSLNLKINPDLGQDSELFGRVMAEAKGGIPPSFDAIQGEPPLISRMLSLGLIEPIDNWEGLLAEISPEAHKVRDKVTPHPVTGLAFVWGTRVLALLYNPKLISEREVPMTWNEMGDPKYAGAFSVPPWTSEPSMGILKYDREKWLGTLRSIGKSKPQVLTFNAGVTRLLLGDVKFLFANTYNYNQEKAKDPNAPVEFRFFEDFTPVRQAMYMVVKKARHPNAAKLFALWAASAEANRIFEKHAHTENIFLGTGPLSQQTLKLLKKQNIQPLTWFDNVQTVDKLVWLGTDEGQKYNTAVGNALKRGE